MGGAARPNAFESELVERFGRSFETKILTQLIFAITHILEQVLLLQT